MTTRKILAAAALSFVLAGCALDEGADPVDPQTATDTQALSGSQYRTIATGMFHSCALQGSGQVACWGRNNFGQLGNGTKTDSATPVIVDGLTDVVALTAGRYHNCAIVSSGDAYCWGYGGFGQLGNGATATQTRPVKVSGLSGVTDIAAGGYHSCAVVGSMHTVECWGYNVYGELGNSTNTQSSTPRAAGGWVTIFGSSFFLPLSGAAEVETGEYASCARLQNGKISCWGNNAYGQLGDGTTTNRNRPGYVADIDDAVDVDLGDYHACAARSTGAASCWGLNNYGQLADGQTGNALRPATMVGPSGLPVTGATRVAAGSYHTCAIVAGKVYCAGRNRESQLGRDYSVQGNSSRLVATAIDAALADAGGYHTCVRNRLFKDICFGSDQYGQLGDDALCPDDPDLSIVSVTGPSHVIARGTGSGQVYYSKDSQIDVALRRSTCSGLSRVRFAGVDLGTSPGPDGGTRYYQIIRSSANGDGTTDMTIRIYYYNAGNGASFPIELAVAESGSGAESTANLTLATVLDMPDPMAEFTMSKDQLYNSFIKSMYDKFGTENYYVRPADASGNKPDDLKDLDYDHIVFDARADGIRFDYKARVVVDDYDLCLPTLHASGKFTIGVDRGELVTNWVSGPDAELDFPLGCDVLTLGATAVLGELNEDTALSSVKTKIEQGVADLAGACGSSCVVVKSITHFDGGIEVQLANLFTSVSYRVPYQTKPLADMDSYGDPIARGLAVPPGQDLMVSVHGLVDSCIETGSSTCTTRKVGGAGLFNWSGETLIPTPWPSCSDPPCPYYEGNQDAWDVSRGLVRSVDQLPKPDAKAGAAVARVFLRQKGENVNVPVVTVGGTVCEVKPDSAEWASLAVGRNDYSGAGAPFFGEYGTGDSLVTVAFIPSTQEGHAAACE